MTATLPRPETFSDTATTPAAHKATSNRVVRLLAVLVMIGGVILTVGGIGAWSVVQTSLADEKITVAEDASWFAGELVDGPLTAYSQADIIEKHALEGAEGMTYAELDREDPRRAMVMNGSFLRASLFTSVVSFGVAAMAMGLGVLFTLVGFTLLKISPKTAREA